MNKHIWNKFLDGIRSWKSRRSQAGIVSYLVLVYATSVLTAGAGLIGALLHSGGAPSTQQAITAYREALKISGNPNLHTDAEMNAAIVSFQKALATAMQDTPGLDSSLTAYRQFIPVQGRSTQNSAGQSTSFPLTIFNYTHNTGRECGAAPVTIQVTVDNKGLGSVAPGRSVTTNVPKGNHKVTACGKAPFNCVSLTLGVPKYTFVYFYWVCRQGMNPLDPGPDFEIGQMEVPGFDPALMDVVFADPPASP